MASLRHDARPPRPGSPLALALDEGLASDPRFLADTRLLAALHRDLHARLDEAALRRALLQAGFVHGLRAALAVRRGPESGAAHPLLAMRFEAGPGVLAGTWPERREAEALRLARGRLSAPGCWASAGYTSGWLSGLWDANALAVETRCAARGDSACRFEVREAAAWRETDDAAARAALDALPHALLRDAVERERRAAAPPPSFEGAFDPESPAVHVWGPVMVVPYAGDETAVAVEAVARDPAAAAVTVVVVDLAGAIVDDGFGAVALERIVEAIESCGAEPLLAGVSPLSERVVAALGRAPLVAGKDLHEAIAAAFRIAEARRHAL